ncbi:hypothetical protein GGR54DRAFT_643356 [Hypoxylon sp. NC1633]|nr:hypothetical protein GGR54DRAFT_643356 [Hypoxylon sp. NC1633]
MPASYDASKRPTSNLPAAFITTIPPLLTSTHLSELDDVPNSNVPRALEPVSSRLVEDSLLLVTGLAVIAFRIYVRVRVVGWKKLRVDDYLMILVAIPFTALIVYGHILLVDYRGISNNGMSPEYRSSLDPNSLEFSERTSGAKLEIVVRVLYTIVLWLTKAAVLAFCSRLTERFGKYEKRIRVGLILLGTTWLVDFLITLLSCRPFHKNWQIQPDPGLTCHPGTSPYSMYGTLGFNILTSLYVFFVPLPILWMANTKFWKKVGLVMLVSANCFVIAVAILRGYLTASSPVEGAKHAGRWSLRVCYVAVVTTNLPLFFPLICRVIGPLVKKKRTQMQGMISAWERLRLYDGEDDNDYTRCSSDSSDGRSGVTVETEMGLESIDEPAGRERRDALYER